MRMHVEALYGHGDRSRVESINDWRGGIAPRFYLGRTNEGNLWRFRSDLQDEVCEELEGLCNDEPSITTEAPRHRDEYVRILSRSAPVESVWTGPAYWFSQEIASTYETLAINQSNAHLLRNGLEDWVPDVSHQQPFMAVIENGHAVSVCASVRITKAAHEAGVETVQSHRRRGHALQVVLSWAHAVKTLGAIPLYSTSDENLASQSVAARLNLPMYGVDFHVS